MEAVHGRYNSDEKIIVNCRRMGEKEIEEESERSRDRIIDFGG